MSGFSSKDEAVGLGGTGGEGAAAGLDPAQVPASELAGARVCSYYNVEVPFGTATPVAADATLEGAIDPVGNGDLERFVVKLQEEVGRLADQVVALNRRVADIESEVTGSHEVLGRLEKMVRSMREQGAAEQRRIEDAITMVERALNHVDTDSDPDPVQ